MADLTRFDFHAFRFMRSEDVRSMTYGEVGQYILLLCESWLTGKDASLPNDTGYLARLARCFPEEVSPLVMKKFQLVSTQWGERYRNETLYEEWLAANGRSEQKRAAAEARWGCTSNADASVVHMPKPSQAVPNQSVPVASSAPGQSSFKNISARYRKFFGVQLAGHNKAKQEYFDACQTYGEDTVLAMFEEWAPDNQWIREKRFNYGLKQFYEGLNEQIAVREEIRTESNTEAVNLESVRAIIDAQKNETEAQLAQTRQAEIDALAKADSWF